jgi:TM2 domain-containing membrane protein YozV
VTSPDVDVFRCPSCGEELREGVKKCRHCNEWIDRDCESCGVPIRGVFAARGLCAECATSHRMALIERPRAPVAERKSRSTAIILAALLGGIGVHRFYLNRTGSGVLYLVFCWTLIPALLAFAEIIRLAFMDDYTFQAKYGS